MDVQESENRRVDEQILPFLLPKIAFSNRSSLHAEVPETFLFTSSVGWPLPSPLLQSCKLLKPLFSLGAFCGGFYELLYITKELGK